MKIAIFLLLLCMNTPTALYAARPPEDPPIASTSNPTQLVSGGITWGNPYQELKQPGAALYLATFDHSEPSAAPHNPRLLMGTAFFKVVSTLHGEKADTLNLSYSYAAVPARTGSGLRLWPALSSWPNNSLAVLTVTKRIDTSDPTNLHPPLVAVALNIRPVSGENDPILRDYRNIAKLLDVPLDKLPEAMIKSAGDTPDVAMCNYLYTAGFGALNHHDCLQVMFAMLAAYDRPVPPSQFPNRALLDILTGGLRGKETSAADRAQAFVAMARLVHSPSHGEATEALEILAQAITDHPDGPAGIVSEDQVQQMKIFISAYISNGSNSPQSAQWPKQILDWLDKK